MGKTAIISLAGSKKRQRIFAEADLPAPGIGHVPLELGPESPAVAADAGMDELMEDDVVGQVPRHDGQESVELDAARAARRCPRACPGTGCSGVPG